MTEHQPPPGPDGVPASARPWTPAPDAGTRRGRTTSSAARRRRRPGCLPRLLLAAVLVLVLAVGAAVGYGVWLARTFDDHHKTVAVEGLADPGDGPVNILLMGTDSRAAEGEADMGERSDTLMLLHVPADRSGVYVASILRDSWVEIPGQGEGKVNAALQRGGYPLVAATVENLLGVPVHHVMVVDFQGFRNVTAALGGVPVCNPTAFSSGQRNPSFYPRGPIVLQDTAALRYVRERKAFGDGDVTRVKNQQRYITGALERFLSPAILLNPARTTEVARVFSEHLATDPGLGSGDLASLAWQLRGVRRSDVVMFTVPRAGFGTSADGQAIVELDEAAVADLRAALQADDVPSYLRRHEPEALAPDSWTAAPGPGDQMRTPAPLLTVLSAPSSAPAGPLGEDPCGG